MSNLLILGNSENRRVSMMREAWIKQSRGQVVTLDWLDYLKNTNLLDDLLAEADVFKIESSGENWLVEREIIACGADDRSANISAQNAKLLELEKGLIRYQRQWYKGWVVLMGQLDKQLSRAPHLRVMNQPFTIMQLFDKYGWAKRVGEPAQLAMPEKLGCIESFDQLLELTEGRGKYFLKPRHSSSASGVLAMHLSKDKIIAQGPIELDGDKLYNTLKVRKYTQSSEVKQIVNLLAKERVFAEKWIRKASVGGKVFDLRVVTTAGKASHVVMRTSWGPITNLHLANARGDLTVLKKELGEKWQHVIGIAEQTASLHPNDLYLGIDVLLTHTGSRAFVIEVNAFGDLLPNIVDGNGRSTYEAQAHSMHLKKR